MAVDINTIFYEDYNEEWHDLSKIVFTSPYIDNPNTAGMRSHVLPGRGDLGLWYEDTSNMYRVKAEQGVFNSEDQNSYIGILYIYPGQTFSFASDNSIMISLDTPSETKFDSGDKVFYDADNTATIEYKNTVTSGVEQYVDPTLKIINTSFDSNIRRDSNYRVYWESEGIYTDDYVNLYYSTNGGSTWTSISSGIENIGVSTFNIPVLSTQVQLKIEWYEDPSIYNTSSVFSSVDGDIDLLKPDGSTEWANRVPQRVWWNSYNFFEEDTVDVAASNDGGDTWDVLLTNVPNTGFADIHLPIEYHSSGAKIKVYNDTVEDISDHFITYTAGQIDVVYPDNSELTVGNGTYHRLWWNSTGDAFYDNEYVSILMSLDDGGAWTTLVSGVLNTGYYDVFIPSGTVTVDESALLKVGYASNIDVLNGTTEYPFKVVNGNLNIIYPTGSGVVVTNGENVDIWWDNEYVYNDDTINIYLSIDGGSEYNLLDSITNSGTLTTLLDLDSYIDEDTVTNDAVIKIEKDTNVDVNDTTSYPIKIERPYIDIISPTSSSVLRKVSEFSDKSHEYKVWWNTNIPDNKFFAIYISTNGGSTWSLVTDTATNTGYELVDVVKSTITDDCKFRIVYTNDAGDTITTECDSFSIINRIEKLYNSVFDNFSLESQYAVCSYEGIPYCYSNLDNKIYKLIDNKFDFILKFTEDVILNPLLAIKNGNFYLADRDTLSLYEYDITSETWRVLSSIPGGFCLSAVESDDYLYSIGEDRIWYRLSTVHYGEWSPIYYIDADTGERVYIKVSYRDEDDKDRDTFTEYFDDASTYFHKCNIIEIDGEIFLPIIKEVPYIYYNFFYTNENPDMGGVFGGTIYTADEPTPPPELLPGGTANFDYETYIFSGQKICLLNLSKLYDSNDFRDSVIELYHYVCSADIDTTVDNANMAWNTLPTTYVLDNEFVGSGSLLSLCVTKNVIKDDYAIFFKYHYTPNSDFFINNTNIMEYSEETVQGVYVAPYKQNYCNLINHVYGNSLNEKMYFDVVNSGYSFLCFFSTYFEDIFGMSLIEYNIMGIGSGSDYISYIGKPITFRNLHSNSLKIGTNVYVSAGEYSTVPFCVYDLINKTWSVPSKGYFYKDNLDIDSKFYNRNFSVMATDEYNIYKFLGKDQSEFYKYSLPADFSCSPSGIVISGTTNINTVVIPEAGYIIPRDATDNLVRTLPYGCLYQNEVELDEGVFTSKDVSLPENMSYYEFTAVPSGTLHDLSLEIPEGVVTYLSATISGAYLSTEFFDDGTVKYTMIDTLTSGIIDGTTVSGVAVSGTLTPNGTSINDGFLVTLDASPTEILTPEGTLFPDNLFLQAGIYRSTLSSGIAVNSGTLVEGRLSNDYPSNVVLTSGINIEPGDTFVPNLPTESQYVNPGVILEGVNLLLSGTIDCSIIEGVVNYVVDHGDVVYNPTVSDIMYPEDYDALTYTAVSGVVEAGINEGMLDFCNNYKLVEFTSPMVYEDIPIEANFVKSLSGKTVTVDASSSNTPYGEIFYYLWDWGDGGTSIGKYSTHTYNKIGTYNIKLYVENNFGVSDEYIDTIVIDVSKPVANFTYTADGTEVTFNSSSSYSLDGSISTYAWDFGDTTNKIVTTSIITHVYDEPGTYSVNLTVTDEFDNTGSKFKLIDTVSGTDFGDVSADFMYSIDGLVVSFDASGSTTTNDTIIKYTWVWGDGTPNGAGQTAVHTYSENGYYNVTLGVTDNVGSIDSISKGVDLGEEPSTDVNSDINFNVIFIGDRSIRVDASESTIEGRSIVNYRWDWGDGGYGDYGVVVEHTY
jgi:PKD repeat protein